MTESVIKEMKVGQSTVVDGVKVERKAKNNYVLTKGKHVEIADDAKAVLESIENINLNDPENKKSQLTKMDRLQVLHKEALKIIDRHLFEQDPNIPTIPEGVEYKFLDGDYDEIDEKELPSKLKTILLELRELAKEAMAIKRSRKFRKIWDQEKNPLPKRFRI